MQKIGIIGGAGPLASSLLYESIVYDCYKQGGTIPEIVILNFPFTRCLTKEEEANNCNTLLQELSYCIGTLEQHRVDTAFIACNTMHLFLRELPASTVKFTSLPGLVLGEAKRNRAQRLLILGSQNSCRLKLYQDAEIAMMYPTDNNQKAVDQIIDKVLSGKVIPEDSQVISQMVHTASRETSIDGVVLGCTDLSVLHHYHSIQSPVPIYDSIKIAAKKIGGSL